jgi:hypothetical protein
LLGVQQLLEQVCECFSLFVCLIFMGVYVRLCLLDCIQRANFVGCSTIVGTSVRVFLFVFLIFMSVYVSFCLFVVYFAVKLRSNGHRHIVHNLLYVSVSIVCFVCIHASA